MTAVSPWLSWDDPSALVISPTWQVNFRNDSGILLLLFLLLLL
jgi:hypothetical protein